MNETMMEPESLTEIPKYLFVIDLDRTLVRTGLAFEEVKKAAEEYVSPGEFEQAKKDVEDSGGSFDVVAFLEEKIKTDDEGETKDRLKKVKSRFLEGMQTRRDEFVYDGADELLGKLEEHQKPYIIGTFGGDAWQNWKIEAAGWRDKPAIVTNKSAKGEWFASEWQQPDGTFAPPVDDEDLKKRLTARQIIFLDDKYKSFEGIPEGVLTVWVQHRGEELKPSQKPPEDATYEPDFTASSLGEAALMLGSMLTTERN